MFLFLDLVFQRQCLLHCIPNVVLFYLLRKRLGHLGHKIVNFVLNHCNLSVPINKNGPAISVCHACYLDKIH